MAQIFFLQFQKVEMKKLTSEEKFLEVKYYYEKSYPKIFTPGLFLRSLNELELEFLYTSMKKLQKNLAIYYGDIPFLGLRVKAISADPRIIEKRNIND